jgi:hypothetical protein
MPCARPRRGGKGDDAARPRLALAAPRPITEGKRNTRVGGLALAEEAGAVVVTADEKLLGALGDTPYAHLGRPLADAGNYIPSTN